MKWIAAAILFLICQKLSASSAMRLGGILVAAGTLEALYGFYQLSKGDHAILWQGKEFHRGFLTGTFTNRNHMAGFLELCLGIHLGWGLKALMDGAKKTLGLWVLIFVLLAAAFFKTGSRSAMISFSLSSFLISFLLILKSNGRTRFFVAAFVLLSLGAGIFLGEPVWQRFAELADQWRTWEGRLVVWADAARLLKDHFWSGIGLGSFEWIFPSYQSEGLFWGWKHAHNDFLELAALLGIPAFLFWLAGAVSLWIFFVRKMMQPDFPHRAFLYGAIIALTSSFIHALTDFNWAVPAHTITLVIISGLAFSLCWETRRQATFPKGYWVVRAIAVIFFLFAAEKAWAGGWFYLGEQTARKGDWVGASRAFEKAAIWDKQNPHLLYFSGLTALRQGEKDNDSAKLEKANRAFDRLTTQMPFYGRARFYRAYSQAWLAKHSREGLKSEDWQAIRSNLEKAYTQEPASSWMGYMTAKAVLDYAPQLSQEEKKMALERMKRSLALHERPYASPYLPPALHFLWRKFSDFEILKEVTPVDFISYKKLTEFCEKKKLWRQHEEIFPVLLELRWETYQSLVEEGNGFLLKRDYARALDRFQKAFWLDASSSEAKTGIRLAKNRLGPAAKADLEPEKTAADSTVTTYRPVEAWYGKGFKGSLLHQKGRMGTVVNLLPGRAVFSLQIRSLPSPQKEFGYVLIRLKDRVVKTSYLEHVDWKALEWEAETPGGRHWLEVELKNGGETERRGPLVELGPLEIRYKS